MRRVCFTLQVRPDKLAEYRHRHAEVWPEMLAALRAAGWRDYSLFLREDGLLVGYFVTEDLVAARAALEATEVNARWQAEMGQFFTRPAGSSAPGGVAVRPDRDMWLLAEIFNLDAQWEAAR